MLKRLIRKLVDLPKTTYQPKEFWEEWSKSFMDDPWQKKIHPQHMWLLKKINASKPEGILEVGCGFGRNIKFLIQNGLDPSSIVGIDISPNMVKLARKYVGNKEVKFFISDLNSFKPKEKFDFVFTHGVLMHIPKGHIESAINRLIDLSKKSLVLIEQNYQADNNYTFIHDYKKLLKSKKLDIIEYRGNKKLGLDLIYAKVR